MSRRPSILKERLNELGADFDSSGKLPYIRDYGKPSREYERLGEGQIGLAELGELDILAVEGDEAVPWLQGLVTNDLVELQEPGTGQRTCILDANGRMLAAPSVLHIPDMLLLTGEADTFTGGVREHLKSQIITEDVKLHDRSESAAKLALFGEDAGDFLNQKGNWRVSPSALEGRDGTWGQIGDNQIIIQRMEMTGIPGFLLILDAEGAHRIWNTLFESSEVFPVGRDALETMRIEYGSPRFGVEIDNSIIPLEAEFEKYISFDKGCYLGQEIVVRLRDLGTPAKKLRTLVFEGGAAPSIESSIEVDGKQVGEIRSSTWSPRLDKPVGLGYIRRKHNDIGSNVEVEGRDATVRGLSYPVDKDRQKKNDASQG